jgi:hypothetical protein
MNITTIVVAARQQEPKVVSCNYPTPTINIQAKVHQLSLRMKTCLDVYKANLNNCNIPGCEARNREDTEVCIAFMHRKSGKFLRF